MAEQQTLAAIEPQHSLNNACAGMLAWIAEPANRCDDDRDAKDLAHSLHDISRMDIPGIKDVWPLARQGLETVWTEAFIEEFSRTEHIEVVFPTDSHDVLADRVGGRRFGANRFRKSSPQGRAAAAALYGQWRMEAFEDACQAMAQPLVPAQPSIPTKAAVRRALGDVLHGTAEQIANAEVTLSRRPARWTQTLKGFLGRAMSWHGPGHPDMSDSSAVAPDIRRLCLELDAMRSSPAEYLADRTVEQLRQQTVVAARMAAIDAVQRTIKGHTDRLYTRLLAHVNGGAIAKRTINHSLATETLDEMPDHPVAKVARLILERTERHGSQDEAAVTAPEQADFVSLGEVVLHAGWLPEDQANLELKRYSNENGHSVLCVEGQSPGCLKLEARARRHNAGMEDRQRGQWQRALRKLAEDPQHASLNFPGLNDGVHVQSHAGYAGTTILYDKQLGGDKLRTYFTVARADACFAAATRRSLGIRAEEPVAILLGRCDKPTQESMLRQFHAYKARGGAIRKASGL